MVLTNNFFINDVRRNRNRQQSKIHHKSLVEKGIDKIICTAVKSDEFDFTMNEFVFSDLILFVNPHQNGFSA